MHMVGLKFQSLMLNILILVLLVLNSIQYYNLDIRDIAGHIPNLFAQNVIKVSNYAFWTTMSTISGILEKNNSS